MKLPPKPKPKPQGKKEPEAANLCIDCGLSKFVDNFFFMDLNGNHILMECRHMEFKFLRNQKACKKWEAK